MSQLQLALTFVHIVSVAFLLGSLATQASWKILADRTGEPGHVARVHRHLLRVDKWFTGPSALVVFASGYLVIRGLGAFGGSIAGAPWALWGLILLFTSLAIWWFGMRRFALRATEEAEDAAKREGRLTPKFGAYSVTWLALWGITVGLIILVAFMMVFKWPGG